MNHEILETAVQSKPVANGLNSIDNEIAELTNQVENLLPMLKPILGQEVSTRESIQDRVPSSGYSDLAQALFERAQRIARINNLIDDARQRIEL